MRNAADAYRKVAKEIASPRDLEASLLLKAAAQLQAVQDSWQDGKTELNDALKFNRKLWSVFISEVTRDDHPLPIETRQNVANLGVFVMNQTVSLLSDPRREALSTLININREIAAGLRGQG
jgi:flagellar protein FlaF